MSQATLFTPASPTEPEPVMPDFFNLYAIAKHDAPEGWRWFELDCSEERCPKGFIRVEGSICAKMKENGRPNYKTEIASTRKVFWFDQKAFDQFKLDLAKEKSVCPECWGFGRVLASFGEGNKTYRACHVCAASPKGEGGAAR